MIVAHRGASADAPENTLEAFNLAWTQGAEAIEGDFHLTRDHEIVCYHDPEIDRRPVADLTSDEIRSLRPEAPMLQQVLETVPPRKAVFVEIKCGPEVVPYLHRRIAESGLSPHQVTVIAFDPDVIQSAKESIPLIQANWLLKFRRPFPFTLKPSLNSVLQTLNRIRADGLGTHPRFITHALVKRLAQAGFAHHMWTVDDPQAAQRYLSWGTRSITTNRPGMMKHHLGP